MSTAAFSAFAESYGDADHAGGFVPPYLVLRNTVDLATLRQNGVFFTSQTMAEDLWADELGRLTETSSVLDPACGAGDLLVPVARVAKETGGSIRIAAHDIEEAFLPLTANRLAARSGSAAEITTLQQDFLSSVDELRRHTHVVLNPPFVPVSVDEPWATGKVNLAAVFVAHAVSIMPPGSTLLAILPDVLRSGSRYREWRTTVEAAGRVVAVRPRGQFDSETDVHVFFLTVKIGDQDAHAPWTEQLADDTLAAHCDVRVGPVVPHRDPQDSGHEVAFLTARNLASGTKQVRRYAGRLENGPLVVVNRTSRPGERPRIRARIVEDDGPLAIENHLLIVKPIAGSAITCETILKVLNDARSWDYLDNRIRCRHLTVAALKGLPWLM